MADLPPVADEVHMQCVHPFRRRSFCKDVVSLVGGHLRSDQPEAFTDTVNMCIDRHSRQPKIKHQYARSRLGAYTRQAAQVVPGIFGRAPGKLAVEVS